MSDLLTIPARSGRAVVLKAGQSIKIINTHGHQVVDTWAFNAADLNEFLSMEHMRAFINRVRPKPGDKLATNKRRPILTLAEDTSRGLHDTFIAACDIYRYQGLGCTEYHENCADNLFAGMALIGLKPPEVPSPLNLWMNIPINSDGSIDWKEPVSKPGDYVVLRAAMDCIVAMSACPQDIVCINAGAPTEAHYQILD